MFELTTFDSLKKNYIEKIESYKDMESILKPAVIGQNIRKLDFLQNKLDNITNSTYSSFLNYSETYFMAGKSLAIARLKYEIELLQACNNVILGNDYSVDHESFSTEKIIETLDNILSQD